MKTPYPTKTLGPKSAHLLNQLQKNGKTTFSLDAFRRLYGKDAYATGDFLSELVKRGLIARLKAGVYLILKTGQENTQLKNWPIIAREIAAPHPYFISHYSAMRLHGMTSHSIMDVYITIPQRVAGKKLTDIKYHFIYSKKEHFWGRTTHWATKQEQVRVSDLERTILDGLDRPDICGGLIDAVRGIWVKQKEIDWTKLAQYTKKFKTKAAAKRLGFITETLKIGNEKFLEQLLAVIKDAKGYVLFDPDGTKKGGYLNRWGIRLNSNVEELKASVWG
ncbi:MAG: type IV toxin-antitoxin system AbiEi family antitoxin [Candidatus Omnitrophota bacterium]|nr:type IV toxin-antitoxin system AbiEi family antitoxin [Candidatus Omnitrophota bacterium]